MKKIYVLPLIALLFASCASSKRPMLVTTVAGQADTNFEAANSLISYGKLEEAKDRLDQAYVQAVSIDDQFLLTRICYSYVSYDLVAEGVSQAEKHLAQAEIFYTRCDSDQKKKIEGVAAICNARIVMARKGDLSQQIKALSNAESKVKDKYYLAYLYRTKGDVYAEMKEYSKADECYLKAADLHTKDRWLSEIGLDYYNSARVRSMAGKKNGAEESIENALRYDKSAENTAAIGLDYLAYARILVKGSCTEEQKARAVKFAQWSRNVFIAGGLTEEAEKSETFLKNLK